MKAQSTVVSQQPRRNRVPDDGSFRLQLQAQNGHRVAVGPFKTLTGARTFAYDLLTRSPGMFCGLRCEYRNRGAWKPAHTWRAV